MIKIFIMNHSKLAIKNKILNKIIIIKLHFQIMKIIRIIQKNEIILKTPKIKKQITLQQILPLLKNFRIILIIYHFQFQITKKSRNLNQKPEFPKVFQINMAIPQV